MNPDALQRTVETILVPSGFLIVSVTARQPLKVELLSTTATRCPAFALNVKTEFCPGTVVVTVTAAPPAVIGPVVSAGTS
jgi:hypothetical protein